MTPRRAQHLTAATVACLALVALLYHIPTGQTVAGDALHACLAAGASLGCLAWAGAGKQTPGKGSARFIAVACLAAALASVAVPIAAGAESLRASLDPPFLGVLALSCLGTAVWEEILFRRLGYDLLREGLGRDGAGASLKAACASALIFALCHVSDLDAQGVLRLAQVALFGLTMSGLVVGTSGLAWAVGTHALYDLICFLPAAALGTSDAWTAAAQDLLALETSVPGMAASLVFLIPAAIWAGKRLKDV